MDLVKKPQEEQKFTFKCPDCDVTCDEAEALLAHTNVHKVCGVCGKTFSNKYHRARHELIHTGERNFKCNVCDSSYFRKDDLVYHSMSHYPLETNHKCSVCQKCFMGAKKLARHEQSHTERSFECPDCGKVFSRNAHLVSHQQVHTNTKDLICSLCVKPYTRMRDLKYHIDTVHFNPKKLLQCTMCDSSFPTCTRLERHVRGVHRGHGDFTCLLCPNGKEFQSKEAFLRHSLRVHKNVIP